MSIHKPLHPGEHVKDVLIDGAGLTVTQAAQHLGVTRTTLSRLMNCHIGLSPEMALRLSKLLNTSVDLWINLQAQYDIWHVTHSKKKIKIEPLDEAA